MNTYSKALRHISMRDVKQKHQQKLTEQKLQEEVKKKEKKYIKSVMETKKYDWRKEIEQVDNKVEEEVIVNTVDDFGYNWRGELVRDRSKYFETGSLDEGMTSKDFEYLYGLSITNLQIDSSLGRVQNNNAQEIVQASSEYSEYQFGDAFPGSFINSIGDNQIISQSKVDTLAFLDTTYGNVSGSDNRFTLTTGPEGLPPAGQSPPGSVISTTNLQTALGVTLPAGVPNGNLGGTPIEGSAIKRVFTKAEPGKRINFNWNFASSEDFLGAASVDDYAFVAIKGSVTKFVSVLTKGLNVSGQFVYTVQPEDIVDGKVEIGIGVMDVFDPYVQTALTISNFGTFWAAGSLGSTTDAADLGMSVAAGMPQSQQKKKKPEEPSKLPGGGTLTKVSDIGFTPQTTFTYDKVTDAGVQKVTTTIPRSAPEISRLRAELSKYEKDLAAYEKYAAAFNQESERLSKAVDAARAVYLRSGQTVAQRKQSYDKLQAAIQAGTDHALSGLRDPNKPIKPTPPKTQPTPKLLTPQQLSNLDKQIADLQRQSEKNKQDAINNRWRAVGELGMGALQAAAILSPIPGDEAVVAAALAAKTGPKAAGAFAKANPGKYNPFLSQQSNKYFNLPRK